MNKYLAENLGKNEKVILEAKFNKMCLIPYLTLIGLGIIFFILALTIDFVGIYFGFLSAVFIISSAIQILSFSHMCLVITDKRVLGKVGLLSVATLDYPIEKVDNVAMSAGILGKFFNYYSLSIQTAGTDAKRGGFRFNGVQNAVEFKNNLVAAIEQHAEDARKAQAEEIAKAMSGKQ